MNHKCPCCGFYTFPQPLNKSIGDICPVCFWEIDFFAGSDDEPSGANHGLSLNECRNNFKEFGACTSAMTKYVRAALPEEMSGID